MIPVTNVLPHIGSRQCVPIAPARADIKAERLAAIRFSIGSGGGV